jgi:hypothetical protein
LLQQTNTPDPPLSAALVAFDKKEDEAWNNNDANTLAGIFTEDAILVTEVRHLFGPRCNVLSAKPRLLQNSTPRVYLSRVW